MITSKVTYLSELRTECLHLKSGNICITDAPLDNNGKGEAFSPTDIVATGLASCMLTVMGIKARSMDVVLDGSVAHVIKTMASDPRRIAKIEVTMRLPAGVSKKNRTILEHTARTCPVDNSLHPDIERVVIFNWG
jgi:putative redox protein